MTAKERRERRRVLFSGNVQGVGFRFRTCRVAEGFAVQGFVRNLSDGRVELVAEGEAGELDRFVAAVQKEMENYIEGSQIESSPGTGEFHNFGVRS